MISQPHVLKSTRLPLIPWDQNPLIIEANFVVIGNGRFGVGFCNIVGFEGRETAFREIFVVLWGW